MRRLLIALIIFGLLVGGGTALMAHYLLSAMADVRQETVASIDFSDVSDGSYHGMYSRQRFSVSLTITVREGQLESIDIKRDLRFNDAATSDMLFASMIQENRLDVDVIIGATLSSIAYQKAIEAALAEGAS